MKKCIKLAAMCDIFIPMGERRLFLCMVMKKWMSKNENITIELDSPEGRCIAIVPKDNHELNKEADRLSNLGMDAAEEALKSGT